MRWADKEPSTTGWHSPLLRQCLTEDKTALLHLLTSPGHNIIGAYALPRIAAAEIGWSQDRWLQVVERLRAEDRIVVRASAHVRLSSHLVVS